MDCARCGLPVPSRRTGDWKRPDVHEPPEDCLEYLKQEVRRLSGHEAEALLRMKQAEEEAEGLKAWVKAHAEKLEQLTVENRRLQEVMTEFADCDNWQISEPDCYGATNYEWLGNAPFEIAATALADVRPTALRGGNG